MNTLPVIGQTELPSVVQIECCSQVAEPLGRIGLKEEPIVGSGGQPGEIEFDGEQQGPIEWQFLQQVGDFQTGIAGGRA